MYYMLILIAVVTFGGNFALNDVYRKLRGSDFASSMESSFIGSVAGLIVLFAISGFDFQVTRFTLWIALLKALCSVGFTLCSFKALDTVNLSLYSLFSMLGGMVLPFFQGILFYDEPMTVAKIVCVVCIGVALSLTVSRNADKKSGAIYYIGVFVLNGMVGVLSKIFTAAPCEKTNAEWFSIWCAVFTAMLAAIGWLCYRKKSIAPRFTGKALLVGSVNGIMNRVANFLLVIALVHVEASVQYPMITGGVMIVSTLICYLQKNKPTKKEILSVGFAFVGMLALFLIKI